MQPRLIDGVLYVPMRAEGNGVLGDGMVPLPPDDPDYAEWLREVDPEGLSAAGWEEGAHPRWPAGSDLGGEFAPKDAGLATEARLGQQEGGAYRVSKAPNLRALLAARYGGVLPPGLLDDWPNLSAEQAQRLRDFLGSPGMQERLGERGLSKERQEAKWVLRDLGANAPGRTEQLPVTGNARSLLDTLKIGGGRGSDMVLDAARTVDQTLSYPKVPGEPIIDVKMVRGGASRQAALWRSSVSQKPQKITVAASGVNPTSSTVHELGHYLDSLLGQDRWALTPNAMPQGYWDVYSSEQATGTLKPVLAAVKETEMYRKLADAAGKRGARYPAFTYGGRTFSPPASHIRYLLNPTEIIARSFEQYVAAKNPGSRLANTTRHAFGESTVLPPEFPGYMKGQDLVNVNNVWERVLRERGLLKKEGGLGEVPEGEWTPAKTKGETTASQEAEFQRWKARQAS